MSGGSDRGSKNAAGGKLQDERWRLFASSFIATHHFKEVIGLVYRPSPGHAGLQGFATATDEQAQECKQTGAGIRFHQTQNLTIKVDYLILAVMKADKEHGLSHNQRQQFYTQPTRHVSHIIASEKKQ